MFYSTSDSDTTVFTTDEGGSWRAEGRLSVPANSLLSTSMAEDGTLLIEVDPVLAADDADASQPPLVAFIRSPKPLGDAGAFRRLEAEGAVAFRPLPGGAALVAISPQASNGKRLDILISEAPSLARVLASGVEVNLNLLGLDVKHGRISLTAHPRFEGMAAPQPSPSDVASKLIVTRGGRLAADWK